MDIQSYVDVYGTDDYKKNAECLFYSDMDFYENSDSDNPTILFTNRLYFLMQTKDINLDKLIVETGLKLKDIINPDKEQLILENNTIEILSKHFDIPKDYLATYNQFNLKHKTTNIESKEETGKSLSEIKIKKDMIKKVTALRKLHSESVADLVKSIGVSTVDYSFFSAEDLPTHLDLITKIANHFNVTTDYLLGVVDDPAPTNKVSDQEERNEVNRIAKALAENPEKRVLFDRTENMTKKDLELVLGLIETIRENNEKHREKEKNNE